MRFRITPLEERIVYDASGLIADGTDVLNSYDLENQAIEDHLDLEQLEKEKLQKELLADNNRQAEKDKSEDELLIERSLQQDELNVIVIPESIADSEILEEVAKENTMFIYFDDSQIDLKELAEHIKHSVEARGGVVSNLALLTHGDDAQFRLTDDKIVTLETLKSDPTIQEFFISISELVDEDGRIDLLACNLAASEEGRELLAELELLTNVNFAASTDLTGAASLGGDWILETDNIQVDDVYFSSSEDRSVEDWEQVLEPWDSGSTQHREYYQSAPGPKKGSIGAPSFWSSTSSMSEQAFNSLTSSDINENFALSEDQMIERASFKIAYQVDQGKWARDKKKSWGITTSYWWKWQASWGIDDRNLPKITDIDLQHPTEIGGANVNGSSSVSFNSSSIFQKNIKVSYSNQTKWGTPSGIDGDGYYSKVTIYSNAPLDYESYQKLKFDHSQVYNSPSRDSGSFNLNITDTPEATLLAFSDYQTPNSEVTAGAYTYTGDEDQGPFVIEVTSESTKTSRMGLNFSTLPLYDDDHKFTPNELDITMNFGSSTISSGSSVGTTITNAGNVMNFDGDTSDDTITWSQIFGDGNETVMYERIEKSGIYNDDTINITTTDTRHGNTTNFDMSYQYDKVFFDVKIRKNSSEAWADSFTVGGVGTFAVDNTYMDAYLRNASDKVLFTADPHYNTQKTIEGWDNTFQFKIFYSNGSSVLTDEDTITLVINEDSSDTPVSVDDQFNADEAEVVTLDVLSGQFDSNPIHTFAKGGLGYYDYDVTVTSRGQDYDYDTDDPITGWSIVAIDGNAVGAFTENAGTETEWMDVVDDDGVKAEVKVIKEGGIQKLKYRSAYRWDDDFADGSYKDGYLWNGVHTFTYTMEDRDGLQSTSTVKATIRPVNDAPQIRQAGDTIQGQITKIENREEVSPDETVVQSEVTRGVITLNEGESHQFSPESLNIIDDSDESRRSAPYENDYIRVILESLRYDDAGNLIQSDTGTFAVNAQALNALSGSQPSYLTYDQLSAMSSTDLAKLWSKLLPEQIAPEGEASILDPGADPYATLESIDTMSNLSSLSITELSEWIDDKVQILDQSQIATLSVAQLDTISKFLSNSQMALLTDAHYSGMNYRFLSRDQVANIPDAKFANISAASKVTELAPITISGLSNAQLSHIVDDLTEAQIAMLNKGHIEGMSNADIASISAAQIPYFSPYQLSLISTSDLSSWPSENFAALSQQQVLAMYDNFPSGSITDLSTDDGGSPPSPQDAIKLAMSERGSPSVETGTIPSLETLEDWWSESKVQAFDISGFDGAQISKVLHRLSSAQIAALTTGQISTVTTEAISKLGKDQVLSFSTSQLSSFTETQVHAIDPSLIIELENSSTTSGDTLDAVFEKLSPDQISRLNNTQLNNLSVSQLGALSDVQVAGFLGRQLAEINAEQAKVQALNTDAMLLLSAEQLSQISENLSNDQKTAIANNPDGDQQIIDLQGYRNYYIDLYATPLNQQDITSFTAVDADSWNVEEIQSFSTVQVEQLFNDVDVAIIDNILPSLSAAQIAAIVEGTSTFSSISPATIAKLNYDQINELFILDANGDITLTEAQIQAIPLAIIPEFTDAQIQGFLYDDDEDPSDKPRLSDDQIKQVTSIQTNLFDLDQVPLYLIDKLSPAQVDGFITNLMSQTQVESLSPEQVGLIWEEFSEEQQAYIDNDTYAKALYPGYISDLSVAEVQALTTTELDLWADAQVKQLHTVQIQALSDAQLDVIAPYLSNYQMPMLSDLQVQNLDMSSIDVEYYDDEAQVHTSLIACFTDAQLALLNTSQIQDLSRIQLIASKEVDGDPVFTLTKFSAAQFGDLIEAQLALFDRNFANVISEEQYSELSTAQISALDPSLTSNITSDAVLNGTGTVIPGFTGIYPHFTTEQVDRMANSQFNLIGETIPDLGATTSVGDISGLTTTELANLTLTELGKWRYEHVYEITYTGLTEEDLPDNPGTFIPINAPEKLQALSVDQVNVIAPYFARTVDPLNNADTVPVTNPAQPLLLSETQVLGLTPANISILRETVSLFDASIIQQFTEAQVQALDGFQLDSNEMTAYLSTTQIPYLTVEQIQSIKSSSFSLMDVDGLAAMGAADATKIQAISKSGIQAMTSNQLVAIFPYLSAEQVSHILPSGIASDSYDFTSEVTPTPTLPGTSIFDTQANVDALDTAAKMQALTPDQLELLSFDQLDRFSAVQIAQLQQDINAPEDQRQVSAIIYNLSNAQAANLTASQIANLSVQDIEKLSTSKAGVLAGITTLPHDGVATAGDHVPFEFRPERFESDNIASVHPIHIRDASFDELANLDQIIIQELVESQIQALDDAKINELIFKLTADQIAYIDTSTQVLSESSLANLTATQMAGFTAGQISNFTLSQAQAIPNTALANLTTDPLNALVSKLSEAQIQDLTEAQVQLIDVSNIQSTQISDFLSSQLKWLSDVQVAALDPTIHVANLTSEQQLAIMGKMTPSQIDSSHHASVLNQSDPNPDPTVQSLVDITADELNHWTRDLVNALNQTQVEGLTNAQLANVIEHLTPAQAAFLTADQLVNLSDTSAAKIGPEQIQSMSDTQLANLKTNTAAWEALDNNLIPFLSDQQLDATLDALTQDQLEHLSETQIAAFDQDDFGNISSRQMSYMLPHQIEALTTAQLNMLNANQVSSLSIMEFVDNLDKTAFAKISETQLQFLELDDLLKLKDSFSIEDKVTQLSTEQLNEILPYLDAIEVAEIHILNQLPNITTNTFAALSGSTIDMLSADQLAALTIEQVQAINPISIPAISAEKVVPLLPFLDHEDYSVDI
ncbi:MAG: DUF4347 domain-containing protein, partial [Chlamydiales bacterium]|nr:DUF4347 domain-containing protein [Chlamydiales bacterium]